MPCVPYRTLFHLDTLKRAANKNAPRTSSARDAPKTVIFLGLQRFMLDKLLIILYTILQEVSGGCALADFAVWCLQRQAAFFISIV